MALERQRAVQGAPEDDALFVSQQMKCQTRWPRSAQRNDSRKYIVVGHDAAGPAQVRLDSLERRMKRLKDIGVWRHVRLLVGTVSETQSL